MASEHGQGRPKPRTPAERAAEFADVQRRLKQEAADRRQHAAANAPKRPAVGSSRSRSSGRPRTP